MRAEDRSDGSTAIVCIYDGRKHVFTVANVGDSMTVLSRGGRAIKMSKQHRLDDEVEKKRVEDAGGTVVNKRVNGVLAITRAMGDIQFKSTHVDRASPVISTPDIVSEIITPMTEFAIIATDGLWDVLSPQAAVNIVRKQLSRKGDESDLQIATQKLVSAALNRGSVDNVTALVISFHLPSTIAEA